MSNLIATKRVDLLEPYLKLDQGAAIQAECEWPFSFPLPCHHRPVEQGWSRSNIALSPGRPSQAQDGGTYLPSLSPLLSRLMRSILYPNPSYLPLSILSPSSSAVHEKEGVSVERKIRLRFHPLLADHATLAFSTKYHSSDQN
jgi:hypothetical protein